MFCVYLLESLENGDIYKGFTEDYLKRLDAHNAGESDYTKHHRPWRLIYVESFDLKKDALIKERKLKRCITNYLKWLVTQSSNILNETK